MPLAVWLSSASGRSATLFGQALSLGAHKLIECLMSLQIVALAGPFSVVALLETWIISGQTSSSITAWLGEGLLCVKSGTDHCTHGLKD